jgi:hypothetical protein
MLDPDEIEHAQRKRIIHDVHYQHNAASLRRIPVARA